MYLNNASVINSKSIEEDFTNVGRNVDAFADANSQTFKAIDGYGTGAFLMGSDTFNPDLTQTVNFKVRIENTSAYVERTLFVTECLSLTHTAINKRLYLIKTAEEKYKLEDPTVARNYNVLHHRTLNGTYGTVLEDDNIPLTLRQIIEDFLPPGVSLVWNVENLYGYNLFIEGMSVIAAIDQICAAYGLIWTMHNDYVYVYRGSLLNTNPSTLLTKINDIQEPVRVNALKNLTVNYKVVDCCVQSLNTYVFRNNDSGSVGRSLDVYCPYVPAVYHYGTLGNGSVLTASTNYLRNNFEGILSITNRYLVRDYVMQVDPSTTPVALEVTYANYGYKNQTILYSPEYPFIKRPEPNVEDRQAKNWVGRVAYSYKGVVPVIQVTPLFGIDGQPPVGTQIVANIYSWNYAQLNAPIRIEWDCVNRRWIPLQQAYSCPPSENPPPAPEPPLPPEETDLNFGSWI